MNETAKETHFYDLLGDFISCLRDGPVKDEMLRGRHKLGILLRRRAATRKAEEAAIDEELGTIDWRE